MNKLNKLVRKGEVCTLQETIPDWAKGHVCYHECSVEKATDGWCIVDWSLQTTIAWALTRYECVEYLRGT